MESIFAGATCKPTTRGPLSHAVSFQFSLNQKLCWGDEGESKIVCSEGVKMVVVVGGRGGAGGGRATFVHVPELPLHSGQMDITTY